MEKQLRVLEDLHEHLVGSRPGHYSGTTHECNSEFRTQQVASFAEFSSEASCPRLPDFAPEVFLEGMELGDVYTGIQDCSAPEESAWAQEFMAPQEVREQWQPRLFHNYGPSMTHFDQVSFRTIGSFQGTADQNPQKIHQEEPQKMYNTSCTNIEDAAQEIYDFHLNTCSPTSTASNWSWSHPKARFSTSCGKTSTEPIVRLEMLLRHFSL